MAYGIYEASVPLLVRMLGQLSQLLEKGVAHAESVKADPKALFSARLALDMYPLSRQVQIATDMAKGAGARLAGVEVPKYADDETDVAQLQARIAKTQAFLKGLDAAKFADADAREIVLKFGQTEMKFTGAMYFTYFVLPNFFFHMTTAYNILRHNGVPVGKLDFTGRPE